MAPRRSALTLAYAALQTRSMAEGGQCGGLRSALVLAVQACRPGAQP